MRTAIAFILVFFIYGTSVQAQELVLRSGDHSTFSRLTIPIPTSQNWEAQKTTEGIVVSLPEFEGTFDTKSVFIRMRSDRISRISIDGNSLLLELSCDCVATTFRSGELLVIDVADKGSVLAGPPIEGSNPKPKSVSNVRNQTPTEGLVSLLPWIGVNSALEKPDRFNSIVTKTEGSESVSSRLDSSSTERADLLNQMQKALTEKVASAASVGLLEKRFDQTLLQKNLPSTTGKTTLKELPTNLEGPSRNLRITSSMDSEVRTYEGQFDATSSGVSCPNEEFLSIENWGTEGRFSLEVGKARNSLTDARDRLNLEAAKTLAKTYLYYGFGAEALNSLKLDPSLLRDFPHLVDVAQILERGSLDRPNALTRLTDCSSSVALWASLSFKKIPADTIVNVDAVLLALNKLPSHLRRIIAPSLSSKLLQYGEAAGAATAMRSVERLPGSLSPESLMAQADLALNSGNSAEILLKDVIQTNSEKSPTALIKLIEEKLSKNESLSIETAKLVEAYAQELHGTELGSQLRQTQIAALSQSGRFKEAFAALDALSPSISPKASQELRHVVFEKLRDNADDLVFLEHLLSRKESTPQSLSVKLTLSLATRLLDLGFAAQAQEMLSGIPEGSRQAERQILAARAALLLFQPFQAQAALIGLEGTEAKLILAEAKEMTGAYREASEIFLNNDAPLQAAQAAWLSDDWRNLARSSETTFKAVASLAQTPEDSSDLGELGRANLALEESGQARDTLGALLNDPTLQILPDS